MVYRQSLIGQDNQYCLLLRPAGSVSLAINTTIPVQTETLPTTNENPSAFGTSCMLLPQPMPRIGKSAFGPYQLGCYRHNPTGPPKRRLFTKLRLSREPLAPLDHNDR